MTVISNKYDFMLVFDVENGNPNGDPDADNMPRIDPETNLGIVTDVCLKRKIRNYVDITQEDEPGFRIYIKNDKTLNAKDDEALKYLFPELDKEGALDKKERDEALKKIQKSKDKAEKDQAVLNFICRNFFDVRTFGAVLTTFVKGGLNSGQVRGPVQLSFARSIDPILPQPITVTRMAVTTEEDAIDKRNTMGKKYIVPYGLYVAEGYVSANLARKTTGFSEDDLELLWQAIINMFEHDHSAARGKMTVRELIVFKHESEFGNVPAHKLFERLKIEKKVGIDPPRKFDDYQLTVDESDLPEGVTLTRMV